MLAGTASGSRLVATIDTDGASRRMRLTSAATGSTSARSCRAAASSGAGRSISRIASSIELLAAEVDVDGGRERRERGVLVDDADELHHVDAVGVVAGDVRASSKASDVLPTPPGPTRVIRRCVGQRVDEQAEQHSRPISGWTAAGSPAIVGRGAGRSPSGAVDDLDRGDELVALPVHRPDDRLPAAVVADRLTHRLDPRGQRRLADEAVAPDLVEQLLLAHDLAATLHEIREDVEDLGLELDLSTVAPQHDAGQVQLAVREPEDHDGSFAHSPLGILALLGRQFRSVGRSAGGPCRVGRRGPRPCGVDRRRRTCRRSPSEG